MDKNYKVTITGIFDGLASLEDLKNMMNRQLYSDPKSPNPDRIMTVDGVKVTKTKLKNIINGADPELQEYQVLRKYPSIGDQLDALFHAGVYPKEMSDKIQAVKDKYPKG